MDKKLSIGIGIKMFDLIWDYVIYPAALKLVRSTSTDYDDKALKFMDDLIEQIKSDLS